MDKEKVKLFLDLLEAKTGDWLVAFAEAGREAFGVQGDVVDVLEALGIPHSDAEVFFLRLRACKKSCVRGTVSGRFPKLCT